MKYTFAFALLAILSIGFASCTNETTTTDMTTLPVAVQNTVKNNFTGNVVSVTTEDSAIGVEEYEVCLDDGTKISFAGEEWDEVEMPLGVSVPSYFLLSPISEYVATNYPGQAIVQISKDNKGYEIELANGIDIDFDINGNFIKVD